MGALLSRYRRIPLKDVTVRKIESLAGRQKNYLVSPAFGLRVVKRAMPVQYVCSADELRKFAAAIKDRDNSNCSPRSKQREIERRLWAAVTRRRNSVPTADVAAEADRLVAAVGKRHGFFSRPTALENAFITQLGNVRTPPPKPRYLFKLWRLLFTQSLTAKALRSSTNYNVPAAGLERAHVLSLYVARKLWTEYRGDGGRVTSRELSALRAALNDPRNLRAVCRHTNRVLHVRYDEEIVKALELADRRLGSSLSSGASQRLHSVLAVLKELSSKDDVKHFCQFAVKRLKRIT